MLIAPIDSPKAPVIVFSDVNMDLNTESQYDIVLDEESIQKSVTMILGTKIGSRVFRRDFGSNLESLLFDPMDDITIEKIKSDMITAIGKWENRIVMNEVTVKPDYPNEQYFVRLGYTIPALGNRSATFLFNLKKGG